MDLSPSNVMTWAEYIQRLRNRYIGRTVRVPSSARPADDEQHVILDITESADAVIDKRDFFGDFVVVPLSCVRPL